MPCADVNSSRLSASKVLALAGAYVGSWHKADIPRCPLVRWLRTRRLSLRSLAQTGMAPSGAVAHLLDFALTPQSSWHRYPAA